MGKFIGWAAVAANAVIAFTMASPFNAVVAFGLAVLMIRTSDMS